MTITPGDPRHLSLIQRVDSHFAAAGFCVSEKTYHDGHMDPRATERLRCTFSPTALHIRANADRIAVHPDDGMAFYYDAKTGGGKDILIEALPLADHVYHSKRGVLCLYCCANAGLDRGFWAHDVPPIRTLFIPIQREEELTQWYTSHLPSMFSAVEDVKILVLPIAGSRDPFVAIDRSNIVSMPSWQNLFEQERKRWVEKHAIPSRQQTS